MVDQFAVLFGVGEHVRARADYGHVAAQYVDELWKLVDGCAPQEVSHFGFAWIVACGLTGVGIGIHAHGAELQAVELASAVACALLSEKYRSGRREFHGYGHRNEHYRRAYQHHG